MTEPQIVAIFGFVLGICVALSVAHIVMQRKPRKLQSYEVWNAIQTANLKQSRPSTCYIDSVAGRFIHINGPIPLAALVAELNKLR